MRFIFSTEESRPLPVPGRCLACQPENVGNLGVPLFDPGRYVRTPMALIIKAGVF